MLKRFFDVTFSLFLIILLLPFLLLISILIKIDSKGPVFFVQKRIGKNNQHFMIYKFRTMRAETPPDIPTHIFQKPESYITIIGKFLRKTSIDEFPQLINIIKGDMSFIGPRPALYNQYDLIELRTQKGIHLLTPGITGWAQVNGRDEPSIEEKVLLDDYYYENKSFLLDLKILYQTIGNVLKSKDIKV